MILGGRLKGLRTEQGLSQGDLQARTGFLRCYISRVENGHCIPMVDTLEKWVNALSIPLYQLFYDGPLRQTSSGKSDSPHDKFELLVRNFRIAFGKMSERHRQMLTGVALQMARK